MKMAWKCTNFKYTFKNLGNKNVERMVINYIKMQGYLYILQNIVGGENETEKVKKKLREKIIKSGLKCA